MAFGKKKDPAEPKAPKEKKPKKEKPPKKAPPPKKEKPAKKEKPPKKGKPPKKPQKGQEAPQEGEELEEGKKKLPIILLLIPIAVIAIAAAVFFIFIWPQFSGGPDEPGVIETEEPKPPELPEKLMVGEVSVPGMTLEANESGAQAVLAKTVTYTYTNWHNAGAAAETYVNQLKAATPVFYVVDEDFVRVSELPDFTAAEGMVLLARTLPKPAPEVKETPAPTDPPGNESGGPEGSAPAETPAPTETPEPEEPVEEIPSYVITVRITWSEGRCVVVADEQEGEVTSSPHQGGPGMTPSIGIRDAEAQLKSMTPAELGLPGTSMSQYEVFPQSGTELVDGVTCIRLDVYNSSDGPNPYLFASSYLMSVNGAHLYKLDPITDELRELDFTLTVG